MRQSIVAFGVGLALALALGCGGGGTISGGVKTPVVYQEPPAPQVEKVIERPGYFWIGGRWDWQNNHWEWLGGRWEKLRDGYLWQAGTWTRRGNSWHWIEGHWAATTADASVSITQHPSDVRPDGGPSATPTARVALYPTSSPPPPQVEGHDAERAGFVFVDGRWDWKDGRWSWVDGRWETARANQSWHPGRWQLQGTYYVWIEGGWGSQRR